MNDHEAQRIAAAMHQLRPDWPAASVLTLIRKSLLDRPRRDVTVALAWVACEANSHTPARVLEVGPWWKASGVEGETPWSRLHDRGPWCKNCGTGSDSPTHRSGICEFTIWPSQVDAQERKERLAEVRAAAAEGRPPQPLAVVTTEPEVCAESPCIRGHGHTGPHQGPPEPEGAEA